MTFRSLSIPFLAMTAGLLLFGACTRSDDGSTAGNTIAGTVVDDKGSVVTNAEVRLIAPDYNPANDGAETGYIVAHTDANGRFAIPKLKPGAITIVFGRSGTTVGGHFYIPGTTRHRRIDTTAQRIGSLTLPYVAAGHYTSVKYQTPEDSPGNEVLEPRVLDVMPEDTLIMLPNAGWSVVRKVTLDTSATGANVLGDNYDWVKLDTAYGNSRTQSFYVLAGNADSASASDIRNVFSSATGYAGLWHFDDATRLADAVGGNDAVNHGAEGVDGVIGKAIRFRGPAWVDVPANAFIGISRKISISFWQKSGDTLQSQPGDIFGGQDSDGAVVLRMHDPFGDTSVYWAAGGADRVEKRTDAEAQSRTGWNFWAVTKDADKGEMTA